MFFCPHYNVSEGAADGKESPKTAAQLTLLLIYQVLTCLMRVSHLTNMSGTASGNHVPLIPFNAHTGKKGSETRAASKPVDASKESNEDSSNPPSLSKSVSSEENTHESDPPSQSTVTSGPDSEKHIDLKACTDVKYEKREDVHGVVVQHFNDEQTWTPVYGRRKRIPLNEAQLRKIPHHCRHPPPSDDDSSSESDTPLTIPENATMNYKVVDGTPGLSITTRKTHHWTPIASRTRARTRNSATKS